MDDLPWEHRDAKQRFLYEQSVQFCRNWFGRIDELEGNDFYKEPVTTATSMEMPMRAGEWTEEWYKQPWAIPVTAVMSEEMGHSIIRANALQRRVGTFANHLDTDQEPWERPECGTLKNTQLKIGERISRVTPDLTSSLRRSRWRKKHFPKGAFPYS